MSVKSTVVRILFLVAGIIASSFLASTAITKYLWGYWMSPPRALHFSVDDQVTGGSRVSHQQGSWRLRPITQEEIHLAKLAVIECGEADIPEQRFLAFLDGPPPSISESTQINALLSSKGQLPDRVSAGYEESAKYWEGVVLNVRMRSGDVRTVFARHTGETSNDRHFYVETLYEAKRGLLVPLKEVTYYFDFAGLEGLTNMWLLAIVATLLCSIVIVVKIVVTSLRRWRFSQGSTALS